MRDRIPTRLSSRLAATARVAAGLGRGGLSRLVGSGDADERLGATLVQELDHLKGLAMKVGQILSTLDVGLPDATVRRLGDLQRGVTPLDAPAIVRELEQALGRPVGELFERFDPVPVAAASVGQVHRAAFGGREVAVKVRYPGVAESLDADVRQLRVIARIASAATAVDGAALVADLRDRVAEECDYAREARQQLRFAALLAGDPDLVVPDVIAERCAATVLTTAWMDGDRFEALELAPAARRDAVAASLVRLPWTTLLGPGVLHADPHPGNFLFPAGGRVVVLDFGCVEELAPAELGAFRALVRAVLDGRRGLALDAASALGLAPHPERIDVAALWQLLTFFFAPYLEDRFRFDRAWWRAGLAPFRRPDEPNARHLGVPPAWMWLQRTLLGTHAVLARLGAEGRFREIVERELG